jgi:hypothetical protein
LADKLFHLRWRDWRDSTHAFKTSFTHSPNV